MHVTLDKRNNNMWKPNAFVFHFPKGGCTVFRKIFPDTMRLFFGEQSGPCRFYTVCFVV